VFPLLRRELSKLRVVGFLLLVNGSFAIDDTFNGRTDRDEQSRVRD
jgi:hypothetical protein